MTGKTFRVIDTGLREGRANIAFDAALIEAHKSGMIGDTIRFLQFKPTALVGRHQILARELRLDYCREHGIGTARRLTGGGAIYMDEGQFGVELVFRRETLGIGVLDDLARRVCTALAMGLSGLSIAAHYRPRNDIEVDGRKLCGTGGFFDGNTLFFQGTVLVAMSAERMISALNVPPEKLEKHAIKSAASRIVTLTELLGDRLPPVPAIKRAVLEGFSSGLGIDLAWGTISAAEESLARKQFDDEIGTDVFVAGEELSSVAPGFRSASVRTPGGAITAQVHLASSGTPRLQNVLITGDFFVTPPRLILDLEAALRGCALADIETTVTCFFANAKADVLSAGPEDFATVIAQAARQAA